ncbi:hypothetical protein BO86DRAFT_227059 [Aspergillus japonicus CBS 114.51]|uniref:Uncharacterized protein n=1 Tax=Aspergillus japonicus CBS 114.51 TaxID=1448312 RepID=A0A8T8X9J5_ASPJA|nr:hypothetical protein BO86DRAFT_227059 [Aspergillus japonicus CBS 114.51]RAH84544.1 hypothetical protein BO86DRAFT_227059 [Aspergillus japonicus CBS 114.51]
MQRVCFLSGAVDVAVAGGLATGAWGYACEGSLRIMSTESSSLSLTPRTRPRPRPRAGW